MICKQNSPFLYHSRSVKAFQELLYINPDFQRANEVHVRLGFMFKVIGDHDKSLKHYNLALLDQSSSCTFTTSESELRWLWGVNSMTNRARSFQSNSTSPTCMRCRTTTRRPRRVMSSCSATSSWRSNWKQTFLGNWHGCYTVLTHWERNDSERQSQ